MMAPSAYDDDALIGEITRQVVDDHGDILQFHKGDDQDAHVDWLLSIYDIPQGATVCDVGCGVGGVAHRMAAKRPDLKWILLNRSDEQLNMCPDIGRKVLSDMHNIPEDVDVIMVNYALGHADLLLFAAACAATKAVSVVMYEPIRSGRVARPDLEYQLQYIFRPLNRILTVFEDVGLMPVRITKSLHTESKSAEAYKIDLVGIQSMAIRLVRFGGIK